MPEEIVVVDTYKGECMTSYSKIRKDKAVFSFKMFLLAMLLALSKTEVQLLTYDFMMIPVSSKKSDKHELENEGVLLEKAMLHWIK